MGWLQCYYTLLLLEKDLSSQGQRAIRTVSLPYTQGDSQSLSPLILLASSSLRQKNSEVNVIVGRIETQFVLCCQCITYT